ncbi:MAG TPA: C1 family peptidase [Anaerovoracaceae bacterium]|nr:C1 family peptidase [Anaerovoracaceae bacterium]
MTRKISKYGWRPDLPDHRDLSYSASFKSLFFLPSSVDLRHGCPPVFDQGELGSCTANAIGAMDEFMQSKEKLAHVFRPSRLFIYYNERAIEGTVSQDSGAMIRDGIKSIAKQGVCPESMWKYDISKFAAKPTATCYTEGLKHPAVSYMRVNQTLRAMKSCLADGYPFVFGFTVYESFESQAVADTGVVPMPKANEEAIGGHAVMAVGYSVAKQAFLVRNSWGPSWGVGGYFWMPFAYMTNSDLVNDIWTLRVVK